MKIHHLQHAETRWKKREEMPMEERQCQNFLSDTNLRIHGDLDGSNRILILQHLEEIFG